MSVLLFFLFFAYYVFGASGTIATYRDAGDLVASAFTLGIAHPPGYPVYVVLTKLFQWLVPFANAAYQANVLSALCMALAMGFLYNHMRKFHTLAAGVAVCVLATAPATVTLARVSEMYSLTVLMAVAVIALAMSDNIPERLLSAYLLGIGMGVQPTLIFLAPFFLMKPPETISPLRWAMMLGSFFALGATVLIFMPVRAHTHPLFNWGDPETWRQFWRAVTRADYGGLKLHPAESAFAWTPGSVVAQVRYGFSRFAQEWGWSGLLTALGGLLLASLKEKERGAFAWVSVFAIAGPGFFLLSNLPLQEDTTPAILQPYLLLPGVCLAWGFVRAISRLSSTSRGLVWGILGLSVLGVSHSSLVASSRQDFLAYDYARNLCRVLPRRSVLFDPDDPTSFTLRAVQTLESRRRDIIPINFYRTRWGYEDLRRRWPDLLPNWTIDNAAMLEQALWEWSALRFPFYAELPQKFGGRAYATEGLVYRLKTSAGMRPASPWEFVARRDFSQTVDHPDFFAQHIVAYYAAAWCNRGLELATAGQAAAAENHYQAALAIDPRLAVAYNNWGNLAYLRGDYSQARSLYRAGLGVDPRNQGLAENLALAESKIMPRMVGNH